MNLFEMLMLVWNFVERVLCNSIHLLFAATPLC